MNDKPKNQKEIEVSMTTNQRNDIAWKVKQAGYATEPEVLDETAARLYGEWAMDQKPPRLVKGGQGRSDEDMESAARCLIGSIVLAGAAIVILWLWKLWS